MSNSTNNEVVIYVETTTSTTSMKPSFPHIAKFMSDENEEMCVRLNEVVIATNVAYKYYPAENMAK